VPTLEELTDKMSVLGHPLILRIAALLEKGVSNMTEIPSTMRRIRGGIHLKVLKERKLPKISSTGMRLLKITHFILIVFFLGGILSSTAINSSLDLSNFNEVYVAYKNMINISDNIVRNGSIGTILLGVIYSSFTNWRFFKYRWLTAKWIIFIAQTFIGILLVDRLMTTNMSLLETEREVALTDSAFLYNHFLRQSIVFIQIALTLSAIIISVVKPWRNKSSGSVYSSGV